MATYNEIIEGLKIQAKYVANGLEAHIGGAEHDVIYGMVGIVVSDDDRVRLEALGWYLDSDEQWQHFV